MQVERVKRARGEEGRRRGGGGVGHVMWGEEEREGRRGVRLDGPLATYVPYYGYFLPTKNTDVVDFLGMKVCALKTLLLI